jgi:acetylornithine deacetylase/succinyl-diaminopimelate desuccinylase-like protein
MIRFIFRSIASKPMKQALKILAALVAAWWLACVQNKTNDGAALVVEENNVRAHMEFLAGDALRGRGSGTEYELIAAQYIAAQLRQFGVEPAGDSDTNGQKTFLQRVTLAKQATWNVVGKLRGSDPKSAQQAISLSAHLDHLGVGRAVAGDSIYNGADDDASGVVAVLELARALGAGPKPKRTAYFILFGSEENGNHGAKHFIENPPMPLNNFIADLQFEMIGRPDSKISANTLWLTGFERSNLGPELAQHGARLVADPHPQEKFFQRSDNFVLAQQGVVAHTISSYGLHPEYHQPNDDLAHIDFAHMTQAINSIIKPVQWLVNSNFIPAWTEGKKP